MDAAAITVPVSLFRMNLGSREEGRGIAFLSEPFLIGRAVSATTTSNIYVTLFITARKAANAQGLVFCVHGHFLANSVTFTTSSQNAATPAIDLRSFPAATREVSHSYGCLNNGMTGQTAFGENAFATICPPSNVTAPTIIFSGYVWQTLNVEIYVGLTRNFSASEPPLAVTKKNKLPSRNV